jgi:hypothetical protein
MKPIVWPLLIRLLAKCRDAERIESGFRCALCVSAFGKQPDKQGLAYLQTLCWPAGLRCPRCASQRTWLMKRGLWLCQDCRHQTSVLAGTVFQDTKLPLAIWFTAMWYVTSQKNGVSALGLQRVLGLGSYRSSWAMLHKLRRAMVRPGRDRLQGVVEVDETYWSGAETGGATG